MKQPMLVLAALAAMSACSEGRDRRVATIDRSAQPPDLTLPDTLARIDTSITLAARAEPSVSPVEQEVAKAEPRPAKTTPPAPKRRRQPTTPKPAPTSADTAVQGYAPNRTLDTSLQADSTPAERIRADSIPAESTRTDSTPAESIRTDSTPADTTQADTTTSQPGTTLAAGDTAPSPIDTTTAREDTAPAPPVDTSTTRTRDSLAARASTAARTLPIGTEIHAALDDSISSRRDTVGQIISAHVMENVTGPDGRTLIAAGTPVRFTVSRLRASRSKNSQGRLALRADGIALNGQLQAIKADVRPVPRELRGRGVTGSDAAKVGGGAVAGAVLGRVVGGNTKGAVIGGVAGAAAGAVVATQTSTRDVVVKAKTPVVIVLTAPLVAP